MSESFKCSSCGACCRRVGLLADFPEATNEDGSCSRLIDDKCAIYDDRPLICRVDEYYEKNLKDSMSKEAWHSSNHEYCNKMMDEDGIDESFRV